jgi:hypothetical protein
MTRTMFDGTDAAKVPATANDMVAGYIDGDYNNIGAIRNRFPHSHIVRIAVQPTTTGADVYDVETGDIDPSQVAAILRRERAAGRNPSVYCDISSWPTVRAAIFPLMPPPYWIAHYDGNPAIPPGAVAVQYLSTPNYDISTVADYWPGVDPQPTPPVTAQPEPEEDPQMFIAAVDRIVPAGTTWPGDFLLTSDGKLKHIVTTADLTAFQNAGIKTIDITYAQYLELTSA